MNIEKYNNRTDEDAEFYLDLLSKVASAWKSHYWIFTDFISITRPKIIVELGTDRGFSALSGLYGLSKNNIDGIIYGIDAWGKDYENNKNEIMKFGGRRVNELRNITIPYFVKKYNLDDKKIILKRSYFEEEKDNFEDNSIDILHIDGNHDYNRVKRDYNSYKDKVNLDNGIIFFHDVLRGVKYDDKVTNNIDYNDVDSFGVYRLFNEIEADKGYFTQHSGLGIITNNKEYMEIIENITKKMNICLGKKRDKIKWSKYNPFVRGNIPTEILY